MKTILLSLTVLITFSGCAARNPHGAGKRPRNVLLEQMTGAEQTGSPRQTLPTQVFCVSIPFTIVVEDPLLLRERIYRELGLTNGVAMFNRDTRTIYVPYASEGSEDEFDIFGRRMPAREPLGHELWHLPELGGWWHIQPPRRLQKGNR